jgi:tripartite-type tricarboxylate transporter receptor subunit TctC
VKHLIALLLACLSTAATASDAFPNKPIRVIVPYSPGGPADLLARVVGDKLHERLGQPVVVDNRPGGSGNIGAALAAKAPADGYTLMMGPVGILVVNALVFPSLPYDPAKDFTPVSLLTKSPFLLATSKVVPVKTASEFIAYAKANPGKVTIGNAGTGTGQHLAGVYFASMTGANVTHVPYKGSSAATTDLLADVISAQFDMIPLVPYVKSGRINILGISSAKRLPTLPDVPTIAETTGMANYEFEAWNGIVAPGATPAPIVARLQAEIAAIMASPEVSERLQKQGLRPVASTPGEFAATIKSDLARYKRLIELGDVKPE